MNILKKDGILRRIWGVTYIPVIYVGMQFLVSYAMIFILTVIYTAELTAKGETNISENKILLPVYRFLNENVLLIVLISLVICFIIFFLFWNKERKQLPVRDEKITPLNIVIATAVGIFANFTISAFLTTTKLTDLFPSYQQVEQTILSGGLPLRIITVGILAPIVEEIGFRGLIFNRLRKYMSFLPSAIISSAIFGIIHLNILQGLYAGLLGILLVYLYEKRKKIWIPILAHASFNLLSVILSSLELEETGGGDNMIENIVILVIGAVITTVLIGLWVKTTRKNELKSDTEYNN